MSADTEKIRELVQEKLSNPLLETTEEQQIDILTYCIAAGNRVCGPTVRGRDIVVAIGNTGAGKSTFLNYLNSCELEPVTLPNRKKVIHVNEDSARKELFAIGHTNQSATLYPTCENVDGVDFCDCPGFLDSRGTEINLANAVNIRNALHAAASVRVVVIINYHSMLADRGRGIHELVRVLVDLFRDVDTVLQYCLSICLGVTKAPLFDDMGDPITLDDVKAVMLDTSGLPAGAKQIIETLTPNLFIYHPLDKGGESWAKRETLERIIQDLEPIVEPSNVFETVANLEDEAAIRNIVAKHCAAAVKAVKRELTDAISNFKAETENEPAGTDFEDMKADNAIDGGYKEAEILLKRVQRLRVVDNQKIYALLRNGMADINRSIRESSASLA